MLEVLRWLKRFDLDGKQITTRRLRSLVENNQMPLREVAEVDYEGNVLTPDPQKMNMFTIYLEEDGPAEVEFRIATVTDVEMAVAYLSSCFVATFTVFAHHGVPPKCAVIAAPKLISELIFRFCDFLDDGERDTLTETLNGTWQIDDKRLESLRLRGCNDIKVYRNQEGDQDENFRVTEEGILRYCLTRDDHLPVPEASRNSQLECNVVLRLEKLRFDVSVLDVGVRPFRSSEYDESAGTDVRNVRYNIADHGNGVRLLIHFKSEDGEEWEVVVRHGKKDEDEFFDEYWY